MLAVPKIQEHDAAGGSDEDVARVHITVQHTAGMDAAHRTQQLCVQAAVARGAPVPYLPLTTAHRRCRAVT